ncbi:MAG: hypothetical protein IT181_13180 [Acidobacteria bacterium]|nr:hypothetical protein [Acidobacteriota bacterium]
MRFFSLLRDLPAEQLNLHGAADDMLGTKFLESAGFICKTVSVNPASIAAGAEGTATATVTGAQIGMRIFATLGADVTVGLYLRGARVTAVNTVTFDYANHSGGAIDEAAHSVHVLLLPADLN